MEPEPLTFYLTACAPVTARRKGLWVMVRKQRRAKGESGIYKHKNGRYEGRYTVQTAAGPMRKVVYGKTRADVATKLAEALAEHENGLTFEAGNLTVGELGRWPRPVRQ